MYGSISFRACLCRIIFTRASLLFCLLLLTVPGTAQDLTADEIKSDPTLLRGLFLPANLKRFAGNDLFLPLSQDTAVPPAAYMQSSVELLEIDSGSRVFVIGRAVGFAAAYIALFAERVYTAELEAPQGPSNTEIWRGLGLENIVSVQYPQFTLQADFQNFDAVLVHGIVDSIPTALSNSLGPGGILLAPLSDSSQVQLTIKIERRAEGLVVGSGNTSFFPGRPLDLEER